MGCSSSREFLVNLHIPGQGAELRKIQAHLGLTNSDINKLYNFFLKVDVDKKNDVSVEKFLVMSEIQEDLVGRLIFFLADRDCDSRLNFTEFVVMLWSFLSFSNHDLMIFFHDIFDADLSGKLSLEEIKFMIDIIWQFHIDEKAKIAMEQIHHKGESDLISLKELRDASKHFESLFFPLFEIQLELRQTTLGDARWQTLCKERFKKFEDREMFEILNEFGFDRTVQIPRALKKLQEACKVPVPSIGREYVNREGVFVAHFSPAGLQREAEALLTGKVVESSADQANKTSENHHAHAHPHPHPHPHPGQAQAHAHSNEHSSHSNTHAQAHHSNSHGHEHHDVKSTPRKNHDVNHGHPIDTSHASHDATSHHHPLPGSHNNSHHRHTTHGGTASSTPRATETPRHKSSESTPRSGDANGHKAPKSRRNSLDALPSSTGTDTSGPSLYATPRREAVIDKIKELERIHVNDVHVKPEHMNTNNAPYDHAAGRHVKVYAAM